MNSKTVAKMIVEEAIVLLKNDDRLLPFSKGQRAAFFGRAQVDTIYSGNGSGAVHKAACKNILEECEKRDVKGLYKKVRAGEIPNFTGISSPYEAPRQPDIEINTAEYDLDTCVDKIMEVLEKYL